MLQDSDVQAVEKLNEAYRLITGQLARVIVGQQQVIEEVLVAMFARGHCLLVGVPGLAKTLLIRTLAGSLSLEFSRIQFTPDLMPSDITGTEVIQENRTSGTREFVFLPGPIFANVILADEINRTPPKTQAALLEAMQEHQLTIGGKRHVLSEPFFVLATQNPIEQEGTYPLPEAQLDRFMFNMFVDYPSEDEELEVVRRTTADIETEIAPTLSAEDILAMQKIVRRVPVAEHVARYAMQLARLTRPHQDGAPDFIRDYVSWGAGPRASQYLVLGAKARAVLQGRFYASCEDVRAVAYPVLRHRILTNFNAEAEGIKPDDIVRRLIDVVEVSEDEARGSGKLPEVFRSGGPGAGLRVCGCVPGTSSKATSPASTAAPSTASRSSSPSTASTRPATTCAISTGRSSAGPTSTTSSSTRKRPTSSATCSWTRARACSIARPARDVEARVRPVPGGGAGLPDPPAAGRVGLVTFDSEIRALVRPSGNPSHLKQLLHVMEQSTAERKTATGPIFHELAERFKKRGVVIVLSDLFDDVDAMMAGLKHFRHRRQEVVLLARPRSRPSWTSRSTRRRCSAVWRACPTRWSSPARCAKRTNESSTVSFTASRSPAACTAWTTPPCGPTSRSRWRCRRTWGRGGT